MARNTLRPEHYKGASSELKAAAFYLDQGKQVFFPVVQQGAVDFVVYDGTTCTRVQVKTATMNHTSLQVKTQLPSGQLPIGYYDILLAVYGDEMWEIPVAIIQSSNISLYSNSTAVYAEYKVKG